MSLTIYCSRRNRQTNHCILEEGSERKGLYVCRKVTGRLNCIDATNKDIAEYAGFDRTNISHLRSGRRKAKPSGTTTEKLMEGICLFTERNNKSDVLCTLIEAKDESSHEDMKSALMSWLFEGTEHTLEPAATKEKKRRPKFRSFVETLETAMAFAGISNIRLSKMVHTDACGIWIR